MILFRQLVFSIIRCCTCGAELVVSWAHVVANGEQHVCIRTRKAKRHCCCGFLWPRSESISLECQDCMNGIPPLSRLCIVALAYTYRCTHAHIHRLILQTVIRVAHGMCLCLSLCPCLTLSLCLSLSLSLCLSVSVLSWHACMCFVSFKSLRLSASVGE